jgi:hypothetical protein
LKIATQKLSVAVGQRLLGSTHFRHVLLLAASTAHARDERTGAVDATQPLFRGLRKTVQAALQAEKEQSVESREKPSGSRKPDARSGLPKSA